MLRSLVIPGPLMSWSLGNRVDWVMNEVPAEHVRMVVACSGLHFRNAS